MATSTRKKKEEATKKARDANRKKPSKSYIKVTRKK